MRATTVTFEDLLEAIRAEYYDPEATRLAINIWDRIVPEMIDREELQKIAERTA